MRYGQPSIAQAVDDLVSRGVDRIIAMPRARLVFQSRFGREPWLEPYADATLKALPAGGVSRVAVMCPGFTRTVSRRSKRWA